MSNPSAKVLDRRAFLSGAAGAAAAAAAGPSVLGRCAALAAEKNRWQMRLSTSTVQFSSLPVEKACERIAGLGFEGIDFWPMKVFNCPHLDEIEHRLGPAGLKELLAKNHLKLCAFTCYLAGPPGTLDYITGYGKYAELLGLCGGGVAVCSSIDKAKGDLRPRMKALIEQLKPQAELAEKYNSYIAIENHGDRLLNSLDSFKAFVDMNRSPRIGIALAPYHLQAAGISVEETIRVVGRQLFFFYAWQYVKTGKNNPMLGGVDQLPGIGPADFAPWLAALAEVDYRGYVNPFMHHHPGIEEMTRSLARSRDYLKRCYAQAGSS
jgi:sugar phosphate isomerase/epimerase